MTILEFLGEKHCHNMNIMDAYAKFAYHAKTHDNICVSISGGADSDVMLDLVYNVCKIENIELEKIHFIFFDTGIEFQATKNHLDFLENKYGIKIERIKAIVPVPYGTRQFGLPFLSKRVSENIERLQRNNFDFANDGNKTFDELINRYPKCNGALKWWCNAYDVQKEKGFTTSMLNINRNIYLKEFLIANPPTFKISAKCCNGAKKNNAKKYTKEHKVDLNLVGIRKAEGGIRAIAYQTCFTKGDLSDYYRPLQWFSDEDKREYEQLFGIKHSDCYVKYGFKRTGCAGCPFSRTFENDLWAIEQYETKLYKAVNKIFGESYEYTRKYRQFVAAQKDKAKANKDQITIDDILMTGA